MKLIKGAIVRLTPITIRYIVRTEKGNYIKWNTANTFPFQFRIISVENHPYKAQKVARIELVSTPLVARRKYRMASSAFTLIQETNITEILSCPHILISRRTKPSTINF